MAGSAGVAKKIQAERQLSLYNSEPWSVIGRNATAKYIGEPKLPHRETKGSVIGPAVDPQHHVESRDGKHTEDREAEAWIVAKLRPDQRRNRKRFGRPEAGQDPAPPGRRFRCRRDLRQPLGIVERQPAGGERHATGDTHDRSRRSRPFRSTSQAAGNRHERREPRGRERPQPSEVADGQVAKLRRLRHLGDQIVTGDEGRGRRELKVAERSRQTAGMHERHELRVRHDDDHRGAGAAQERRQQGRQKTEHAEPVPEAKDERWRQRHHTCNDGNVDEHRRQASGQVRSRVNRTTGENAVVVRRNHEARKIHQQQQRGIHRRIGGQDHRNGQRILEHDGGDGRGRCR